MKSQGTHSGATPARPVNQASLVSPWGPRWSEVRWYWCNKHRQHEREDVACASKKTEE